MYGQVYKQYQDISEEVSNNLFWYYPPDYENDLAHPVSSAGKQIKLLFIVYLDEWLCDTVNVELWDSGLFPDSRNKILVAYLLIKVWRQFFSHLGSLERYFTKVGCGM